jgi:hypothetical protein
MSAREDGHHGRGARRRMVWLALVTAGLFVILILAGVLRPRLQVANYPSIRPGMTAAQVEEFLGGPPGDYGWWWLGSTFMTQEGSVAPPGSREAVWFNDDHRIEVSFDDGARVVAVHKRAGWIRRPWLWRELFNAVCNFSS